MDETLAKRRKRKHAKPARRKDHDKKHDRVQEERRRKKKKHPTPPPPGCPGGTVTCGSDCFPECCPGTSEASYSGPTGTENVGVCRGGTRQCQNGGTWGACRGDVTPSAETCDGLDNDCDGAIDNGSPCPTDDPATCGRNGQCVVGTCAQYSASTICRPAACRDGIQTLEARCDGSGQCPASQQQSCPNGACHDAVSCGPCAHDHDCGADRWCNGGTCQETQATGTVCAATTPQQCQSGFCVGGVCCASVCTAPNATASCAGGTCALTCQPGFADCNGTMSDGCEVATRTDTNNCGNCGHVCPTGYTCQQGSCQAGTPTCDCSNLNLRWSSVRSTGRILRPLRVAFFQVRLPTYFDRASFHEVRQRVGGVASATYRGRPPPE
jgi:hypothetical protein